jgi:hypothetical protein
MRKLSEKILILLFLALLYILLFLSFDTNDKFGVRINILHNLSDIKIISYDGTKTAYSPYANFDYIKHMERVGATDYTVILGDSRLQRVNCQRMYKETGEKYVNLSFGGCTLDEEVFELKYLMSRLKMKKVIFLVDIYTLNKYRNLNRLAKIPDMTIQNYIFDYWNNKTMLEELGDYIKFNCIKQNKVNEKVAWDNKRFILHISNVLQDSFPYAINQDALDELDMLVRDLEKKGTDVIFYIPPVYKVFYNEMLEKHNLVSELSLLIQKLSQNATVYDMQYLSKFTLDDKYWIDNFHLTDEGMQIIENIITGKEHRYLRITNDVKNR